MTQKINQAVSVSFVFNHNTNSVKPQTVLWNNYPYKILKVGLHHSYRRGETLFHVFSVVSDSLFFRLTLNTDTLFWNLEEISDGQSN